MDSGTIKSGARLCYKKNENGYAWVTVTDHSDGKITYIREGKAVTVPDDVLGTRLFETLQETRENGIILDICYEDSNSITSAEKPKKLDYFLGETGVRKNGFLSCDLISNIEKYIDDHLILTATIRRLAADRSREREEKLRKETVPPGHKPVSSPTVSAFDFGPGRAAVTPSPFMEFAEDEELPLESPASQKKKPEEAGGSASKYRPKQTDRPKASVSLSPEEDLPTRLRNLDKSFGETLLDLIDEKGIKNSDFYNRANISKQLFYRITTQLDHPPRKNIALACAIALNLDLSETKALLEKAGYALSPSNVTDVIVEAFIAAEHYDIFDINEYLWKYDQGLLGSDMR